MDRFVPRQVDIRPSLFPLLGVTDVAERDYWRLFAMVQEGYQLYRNVQNANLRQYGSQYIQWAHTIRVLYYSTVMKTFHNIYQRRAVLDPADPVTSRQAVNRIVLSPAQNLADA